MSPELVDNTGGLVFCPWCSDTGQLSLREWESQKNAAGAEYKQQVEAFCGFCTLGHQKHSRYGGRWHYAMEDVDVIYSDQLADHLAPDVARRVQKASEAFALRRSQMQLPVPRPPALDAAAYEQVQSDTLGPVNQAGSLHLSDEMRDQSQ